MSWEQISNSNTIDIKKNKGKEYSGVYTGRKEIDTKIGKQFIYNFESESEQFGIYGFTNLNRYMECVKVGDEVKITYEGTVNCKTKFGMKDVHQVKVERWVGDGADKSSIHDEDDAKLKEIFG